MMNRDHLNEGRGYHSYSEKQPENTHYYGFVFWFNAKSLEGKVKQLGSVLNPLLVKRLCILIGGILVVLSLLVAPLWLAVLCMHFIATTLEKVTVGRKSDFKEDAGEVGDAMFTIFCNVIGILISIVSAWATLTFFWPWALLSLPFSVAQYLFPIGGISLLGVIVCYQIAIRIRRRSIYRG